MQEIFEEYGEFIVEAVASVLFLLVVCGYFLDTPIKELIMDFIANAVG